MGPRCRHLGILFGHSLVLLALVVPALCFMPGESATLFKQGELVDIMVGRATSHIVKRTVPFYKVFPFCEPEAKHVVATTASELIRFGLTQPSRFSAKMSVDEGCKVLCQRTFTSRQLRRIATKISEAYRGSYIIDGMPAIFEGHSLDVPLGYKRVYSPESVPPAPTVMSAITAAATAHAEAAQSRLSPSSSSSMTPSSSPTSPSGTTSQTLPSPTSTSPTPTSPPSTSSKDATTLPSTTPAVVLPPLEPPYGFQEHGRYYLYNHIRFVIHYSHESASPGGPLDRMSVVKVEVVPFSIRHQVDALPSTSDPNPPSSTSATTSADPSSPHEDVFKGRLTTCSPLRPVTHNSPKLLIYDSLLDAMPYRPFANPTSSPLTPSTHPLPAGFVYPLTNTSYIHTESAVSPRPSSADNALTAFPPVLPLHLDPDIPTVSSPQQPFLPLVHSLTANIATTTASAVMSSSIARSMSASLPPSSTRSTDGQNQGPIERLTVDEAVKVALSSSDQAGTKYDNSFDGAEARTPLSSAAPSLSNIFSGSSYDLPWCESAPQSSTVPSSSVSTLSTTPTPPTASPSPPSSSSTSPPPPTSTPPLTAPVCKPRLPETTPQSLRTVIFTYDIVFERSQMRAAARWDAYAHVETPAVHWVALFNSLAGVVLLTVAVGVITKHALSRDIQHYKSVELSLLKAVHARRKRLCRGSSPQSMGGPTEESDLESDTQSSHESLSSTSRGPLNTSVDARYNGNYYNKGRLSPPAPTTLDDVDVTDIETDDEVRSLASEALKYSSPAPFNPSSSSSSSNTSSRIASSTASFFSSLASSEAALKVSQFSDMAVGMLSHRGWKLVEGDVFRPPKYPHVLAVLIGSGTQISLLVFFSVAFAFLGVLLPVVRVYLLSAMLIWYTVTAVIAGYATTRLVLFFETANQDANATYRRILTTDNPSSSSSSSSSNTTHSIATISTRLHYCLVATGLVYPTASLLTIGTMQMVVSLSKGDDVTPYTTTSLLVLSLFLSLPFVYLGCYFGIRSPPPRPPVPISPIARAIHPPRHWYHRPYITLFLGALFTFAPCLIELQHIVHALWINHVYTAFGFLFLILVVVIITAAEAAIVTTYLHLSGENYHWWWRSFITCSASGLLLYAMASSYLAQAVASASPIAAFLFLGLLFLCSLTFSIVTGTIGFWASCFFIRTIYTSISDEG